MQVFLFIQTAKNQKSLSKDLFLGCKYSLKCFILKDCLTFLGNRFICFLAELQEKINTTLTFAKYEAVQLNTQLELLMDFYHLWSEPG